MDLKFAPRERFPGKGHCIELQGDWVTERVWNAVKRAVGSNLIDCDYYKSRRDFCVFFQGGYDNPKGKWILLEFWIDDLTKADEFLRLLWLAINDAIIRNFTHIRINAHNMGYNDGKGSYGVLTEIQKETGCPVDWGCSMSPITFHPEDNEQCNNVLNLCRLFDLKVTPWVDPGV